MAEKKKQIVLHRPIYVGFMSCGDDCDLKTYTWYVIEDFSRGERKKDRSRELLLPDIESGVSIENCSLAAADTRLFLIGGYYKTKKTSESGRKNWDRNEICYIDIDKKNPEWKSMGFQRNSGELCRSVVSDGYGDWMYTMVGLGSMMLRFNPDNLLVQELIPSYKDTSSYAETFLLDVSKNKIFLVYVEGRDSDRSIELACYDLELKSWCQINASMAWLMHWGYSSTVVVDGSYLITFGWWNPKETETYELDGVGAALYVYDIRLREWLTEPVKGLKGDGIDFPSGGEDDAPIIYSSLMYVQREELKLAFVWSTPVSSCQAEVRWSKFKLHIHKNQDDAIPPTFSAESLSSGFFYTSGHWLDITSG